MSQPRDDRQDDLFRPPLEEIINFRHPLVRLAGEIDWDLHVADFHTDQQARENDDPSIIEPIQLSMDAGAQSQLRRSVAPHPIFE